MKRKKLGIAVTMRAAAGRTGLPWEIVQRAKWAGCAAFRPRGDVDCDLLMKWIRTPSNLTPMERMQVVVAGVSLR